MLNKSFKDNRFLMEEHNPEVIQVMVLHLLLILLDQEFKDMEEVKVTQHKEVIPFKEVILLKVEVILLKVGVIQDMLKVTQFKDIRFKDIVKECLYKVNPYKVGILERSKGTDMDKVYPPVSL